VGSQEIAESSNLGVGYHVTEEQGGPERLDDCQLTMHPMRRL
jgi:hypothetical protein